jgi:hypothetical protein
MGSRSNGVREWAPPGWHWEVTLTGERSCTARLVRNAGMVVDPDLLWWPPSGPRAVQREPAPEQEVRRRIRREDEHVRRYMTVVRDTEYADYWVSIRGPHVGCDRVWVPYLWKNTARDPRPGHR